MTHFIDYWDFESKSQKQRQATAEEVAQMIRDQQATTKPVVPFQVTPRQAKLALALSNKLQYVQPVINALPEPQKTYAQIEWDNALTVERSNQLVHIVAQNNGWTDEEVDQLFITAATL